MYVGHAHFKLMWMNLYVVVSMWTSHCFSMSARILWHMPAFYPRG